MMQRPGMRTLLAALAMASLTATATGAMAAPPAGDVDFMKKAAEAGHMEIEASNLAQSRASSTAVKAFATQMVTDHRAAADELKRIADAKGVQLPAGPAIADRTKLQALDKESGAAFDKQYASEVGVKAHNEAVALFKKASNDAQDADVKAFAKKTLPTLERHQDMAKKMAQEVGTK